MDLTVYVIKIGPKIVPNNRLLWMARDRATLGETLGIPWGRSWYQGTRVDNSAIGCRTKEKEEKGKGRKEKEGLKRKSAQGQVESWKLHYYPTLTSDSISATPISTSSKMVLETCLKASSGPQNYASRVRRLKT